MINSDNNFKEVVDFCKADSEISELINLISSETLGGAGYKADVNTEYHPEFFLKPPRLAVTDITEVVYFISKYLYTRYESMLDELSNEKIANVVKSFLLTFYIAAYFRKEIKPDIMDINAIHFMYNATKGSDIRIEAVGCFPGEIKFLQTLITNKTQLEFNVIMNRLFATDTPETTFIKVEVWNETASQFEEQRYKKISDVNFSDIKDMLNKAYCTVHS